MLVQLFILYHSSSSCTALLYLTPVFFILHHSCTTLLLVLLVFIRTVPLFFILHHFFCILYLSSSSSYTTLLHCSTAPCFTLTLLYDTLPLLASGSPFLSLLSVLLPTHVTHKSPSWRGACCGLAPAAWWWPPACHSGPPGEEWGPQQAERENSRGVQSETRGRSSLGIVL